MAEFDSSITAYIGGDYSGLTEAVTGAEGQIKQLDAKFETLGANMTKVPQAFAEENKKAMAQILSGEERLAAYREKMAFGRMTDEEKLAVLRAQGMGILNKINSIEGETVEKTGLKLQLEKKKTEIYDLNNKVTADGLVTQKAATEETGEHTKKATGLAGVVENLKKSFKDMGVNLQGAGIGIAFAGFISLGKEAIDNAQKQRDAYEAMGKPLEASTASLARLGDALDEVKKAAVAFVGYTISGYTQMGELIGETINSMKGISEIEQKNAELSERAANAAEKRRDAARTEAMDVDKIHAAQVALRAAVKAADEAKMTDLNKLLALKRDEEKLEQQIAASAAQGVKPIEYQTALVAKRLEIRAQELAIITRTAALQLSASETQASLDITTADKLSSLKRAQNILADQYRETVKATGAASAEAKTVEEAMTKNLTAQTLLLRGVQSGIKLDAKEYEELIRLQLKGLSRMTQEERVRYDILMLQSKERELQIKIDEELARRRTKAPGEITAEENKVLLELDKQKVIIDKQIEAKVALGKRIADNVLPAEGKITTELEKQTAEAAKRKAIQDAPPPPAPEPPPVDNFAIKRGQVFGGGGTQNYQAMSTAMLQGLLSKQNDILTSIDYSGQQVRNATFQLGDTFAKQMADSQIFSIERELNLRKEIQDYGMRMGDIATIMKYGDAQTQRAFNAVTQGADKTNTMLAHISQQLSASGLFGSGGGIR